MSDIFASARLLVRGAREDIDKLDAAFRAYFDTQPYTQSIETDLERGVDIHKIKLTKALPEILSRDVARIASELRSALDQAGYATAVASGNTRLKNTYFPFAPDALKFNDVIKGRCRDLPQDIVALFRSFNAYRGGDDLLWSVNEIANGIKHRFIVPVGQDIAAQYLDHIKADLVDMVMPPRWDRTKDEIVLFTVKQGTDADYKIKIGFF